MAYEKYNFRQIKRTVIAFLMIVAIAVLLFTVFCPSAGAVGLVDDTVDMAHEYSRYPLENCQLDFYVDNGWDWLPWNWVDGIGKQVMYGLYCITNFIWTINLYLFNASGFLVQEAYGLDFIPGAADAIGKNIQTIAGISPSGLSTDGFYAGFLLLIILIVGVYVAYTGIIKRETTKAVRPVVIALWALLICAFAFAVYKNFTAVDTHTVHETMVVQEEVADTNAIESFVTNFAKVYYSWEQSADSIEQRTENLKYYLTDELQALNADTVRSDVPVSSKVEDVQVWSVEKSEENVYKVVFAASQKVINGEESSVITPVYEVSVYVDDTGDMVIIQSPTITGKLQKSDYAPKTAEPDGTVSAQESTEITEFLTTFFTLYPAATEQELSYYVSGGALPVIGNESYMFAGLVNPVFTKSGDTVTVHVAVQYLDQRTGMTQVSQFVLQLRQIDGNWKVIKG